MDWLRNQWVQAALMLAVGAVLVYLVFAGQNIEALWGKMRGANLWILGLAVLLSGLGHVLRALRWKSLMAEEVQKVHVGSAFVALMIGYLVNFAIPRLGELTRCAVLFRLNGIPVLKSLGTVVVERVVDVLALGILVVVTVVTAAAPLQDLLEDKAVKPIQGLLVERGGLLLGLAIIGVVLILFVFVYFKRLHQSGQTIWIRNAFQQVILGLRGIFKMPSKAEFVLLTVGIWVCYWSGPVCTIWAMGMLNSDWVAVSFAMFTMGSVARTIPIPAGSIGPYHFLVSQVLISFGFDPVTALAAATVNHATQTFFYFAAGSTCALALPILQRKRDFLKSS